jgi:hypothetical protein
MRTASLALAALLCGCGNSSSYAPYLGSPTVGTATIFLGEGATSLNLPGSFFAPGMTVFWNGVRQVTHVQSSTQAIVDLDPGLTAAAVTVQVTAQNEGSLLSAPIEVSVLETRMTLTAASPAQLPLGGPDSTITITGSGFRSSDVVSWNGGPLATTLVDKSTLSATVPASLLGGPSDGFIRVSDPACTEPTLCTTSAAGVVVQVGAATRKAIGNGSSDAVWDATDSEFLLLSFEDFVVSAWTPSNTFVTSSQSNIVLSERRRLAISDGDQFVYGFAAAFTSPPSNATPLRLSLPGLTNPVQLAGFPAPAQAISLAPAPGAASTIEVLRGSETIIDGTTPRAKTGDATGLTGIEWGFDATTLYGIAPSTPGVVRFDVDATGITGRTTLGSTQFALGDNLHYDRIGRRLYGDSGLNLDEQGADPRPFAVLGGRRRNCVAVFDASLGKAFFACLDDDFGNTILSFDLATQRFIGNVLLRSPNLGAPQRIFRYGADGLAVVVGGALLTYQGPFVH